MIGLCIFTPCLELNVLHSNQIMIHNHFTPIDNWLICISAIYDIRYIKYTFCRIFYRVVFVVFSIRLELLRNTVRNFDRNEERQDKVAEMNVNNISILFRIIKLHFISWTGLISYIVCQPVLWTLDFACTMYMRWRIQSWNPNCVPQHITSPWSL